MASPFETAASPPPQGEEIGLRMLKGIRTVGFMLALLAAAPAFAVQPDEILKDPALEARARNLSQELRCMVCQNQSIDDSEAPLARDLRLLVRERLTQGDSDSQVMKFLVDRYGAFVLLKPPVELNTLLLWSAAPVVLLIGIGALVVMARRRKSVSVTEAALSGDEQRRIASLAKPGE
jgi:cytochrome c-type biogenesis protein CcmH